jgi:hypothetical protein
VKVQLTRTVDVPVKDAANALATSAAAEVVQVIGRTATLYRHNPDLKRRPAIRPPGAPDAAPPVGRTHERPPGPGPGGAFASCGLRPPDDRAADPSHAPPAGVAPRYQPGANWKPSTHLRSGRWKGRA